MNRFKLIPLVLFAGMLTSTVSLAREFSHYDINTMEPLLFSRYLSAPLSFDLASAQSRYGSSEDKSSSPSVFFVPAADLMSDGGDMEFDFNQVFFGIPSIRKDALGFGYWVASGSIYDENKSGPVYQNFNSVISEAVKIDYEFDNNIRIGMIGTSYFNSSLRSGSISRWNVGLYVGKRF